MHFNASYSTLPMNRRVVCLVLLAGLTMASASWAQSLPVSFKAHTRKPADKVEFANEGDKLVVNISSADGIGSATLTRIKEQWPSKAMLRFNLRNLEFIHISNSALHIEGRLKADQWEQNPPQKGRLAANIRKNGASIEVEVPEIVFQGNPGEVVIKWINEYR
jgi:hypothetical protein